MTTLRPRLPAAWFERLYEHDADPWCFASSAYEAAKYRQTLAALEGRRFGRALEVGCSIGVFTALLAGSCDALVSIDVSDRALARARERLAKQSHVHLERAAFPERIPGGSWDLIVCSEVLYYLDEAGLELAVRRLAVALESGGTVLAVHWRPATQSYPFRGDEVHDRLLRRLGRWHALDARTGDYRLDRFDGRRIELRMGGG